MTEREQKPTAYTAADALLEGLVENGVTHLFGNFGSDHPGIIESLAKARRGGRNHPRVVISPHESVALAAAHGHALVSGQAQGVIVHCDVGTQTLGGAVHNAARARIPVFIYAGETSFTIEGERFGTRNRPVQFIQDVRDQHSIVRPYMKWTYSLRIGENVKQLAYRGMQIAASDPKGPVYLSGAREVLEETIEPSAPQAGRWPTVDPAALPEATVAEIVERLARARHPLLITSYLGRSPAAVEALTGLADTLGLGVVETSAAYVNFPTEHPLHLGFEAEPLLADADVIVVLDCDVPWVPVIAQPGPDTAVFHIDVDPLKDDLPLWHFPATRSCRADGLEALHQLCGKASETRVDADARTARIAWASALHERQRASWSAAGAATGNAISADLVSRTLRELIDEDAIVLDETITNTPAVRRQVPRSRPGSYFQSGGSSLGWHGGAAIGAKLAAPEREVVALTGDGSYFFSVPSAVHWMARRYQTPFLTVIYNNGGWNATKQNVLKLHPHGAASETDHFWVNFQQPADYAAIAQAAGDAHAATVRDPDALAPALEAGLAAVRSGRAAVVDVILPPISAQED